MTDQEPTMTLRVAEGHLMTAQEILLGPHARERAGEAAEKLARSLFNLGQAVEITLTEGQLLMAHAAACLARDGLVRLARGEHEAAAEYAAGAASALRGFPWETSHA